MRRRCRDKHRNNSKSYSRKGIAVCERWNVFENFLLDMGKAPLNKTLERMDNNKGYYPENCKWASKKEQAINRNNTIFITFEGLTKSINEWAQFLGINKLDRFRSRVINHKWDLAKAACTQLMKNQWG
jgi:hypothetical protein